MAEATRESGKTLVNRGRERALLGHLLNEAREGHPSVAVVSGVPGAGKTALARWAAEQVAAEALVLRTTGTAGAPPLATVGRLVRAMPDLGRLVDEQRGRAAGTAVTDLARALTDALLARARWRLVLVVVDDVHLVDEASATVLDELIAAVDDASVVGDTQLCVLLTSTEPAPPGTLAERAARLDVTRALSIGGFDAQDLYELALARGRRLDPADIRKIHEDTGGLPLLAETAIESGGRSALRVRSIADAIRVQLDRLDDEATALLQVAAVLGDPWRTQDVASVGPVAELDTVAELADSLVTAGILASELGQPGHPVYRFAHPLVRAELLARLDPRARQRLHLRAADHLDTGRGRNGEPGTRGELGSDDELTLQAAAHRVRAGDEVDDAVIVAAAVDAGPIAMRGHAWSLAAQLFRAAASVGERQGDRDGAARWLVEAGRADHYDHDIDRLERDLGRAIELTGDARVRLDAALLLVRAQLTLRPVTLGQRVDTAVLESAVAEAAPADALVVDAESLLADVLFASGEHERALDVVEAARVRAERDDLRGSVDEPRCRVEVAEGLHRLALLELPRAQACFAVAEQHAAAAGEPQTMIGTASRSIYVRSLQGDVSAGLADLPDLIERAVARGIWSEACFAAAQLAFLRTLAGRPDAVVAIDQAQRWHRRSDYTWGGLIAGQAAAALAAREGRAVEPGAAVRPSFVEALAAVERHDVERARVVAAGARWRSGLRGRLTVDTMAIAVALIEVGDLLDEPDLVASAVGPLAEAYDRGVLVAVGWPALVPRLLATAARLGGDLDRADRLLQHGRGLAERHDLRVEQARVRLERARIDAAAGASADQVRDQLAGVLTAFDELGLHGWVARTEAVAVGLGIALLATTEGATRDRTIFTTDVVGSTAANARLGDALYLEQLRVHDRLVRARLREWRGIEIKHTGDGINASFDDPVDAVRCVLALCNDFRGWQHDAPDRALEMRCALAKGRLIASEGDYFGLVQSEAARLCARAEPGEVLVTGALARSLPDGVGRLDPRGTIDLRGLPEPVEILALAEA